MERKDEERKKRVYEASVTGSVNLLKQLMAEDALTLARAAVTCFNETPLHVAVMLDHLDFTKYLLTQKPDMTMAVDSRGRSPLHLASANGYVEMVNILLSANSDACLIQDEDGRTPLHLAVMKGQIEIVRKLFGARRQVARYKLDQGETILHSVVKQNRLGVLKMLLELEGEVKFLNSKDDYGNTVLHTATALKQFETVKYLVVERAEMEVNAVNENGFTALDIIQHMPRDLKGMEIRECLVKAGGLSSCRNMATLMGEGGITMVIEKPQLPPPPTAEKPTAARRDGAGMRIKSKSSEKKKDWMKKKRDALMIAATLIVGMTFQIAVNPPGGVWEGDKNDLVLEEENNGTLPQNNKTMIAGTSIMAHNHPEYYERFMAFNSVCFFASLSIVFLVVSGVPFVKTGILMWLLMIFMWIILTCLALTYLLSMVVISPTFGDISSATWERNKVSGITAVVWVSLYAWVLVVGIVILIHAIRFLVWCVRKVVWCMRKLFSYLWKVGKCGSG